MILMRASPDYLCAGLEMTPTGTEYVRNLYSYQWCMLQGNINFHRHPRTLTYMISAMVNLNQSVPYTRACATLVPGECKGRFRICSRTRNPTESLRGMKLLSLYRHFNRNCRLSRYEMWTSHTAPSANSSFYCSRPPSRMTSHIPIN